MHVCKCFNFVVTLNAATFFVASMTFIKPVLFLQLSLLPFCLLFANEKSYLRCLIFNKVLNRRQYFKRVYFTSKGQTGRDNHLMYSRLVASTSSWTEQISLKTTNSWFSFG